MVRCGGSNAMSVDEKSLELCVQLRVNRLLIGAQLARLYEDVVQEPLPSDMALLVERVDAQTKKD